MTVLTRDMVLDWLRSHGEPRTIREVAEHFGCERRSSLVILRRLAIDGQVVRCELPAGRAYQVPRDADDDDLGDNEGFPFVSHDEVVRSALENRDPFYLAWWGGAARER